MAMIASLEISTRGNCEVYQSKLQLRIAEAPFGAQQKKKGAAN
jgi:hypothetical protein